LPPPLRKLLYPFYVLAYHWIRNHYGIILFWTTSVSRRVIIPNQGNVNIHGKSVIGDDCVIRQNVTIGGVNNDRNDGPILGRDVQIGAGAVIIGAIHIGDGARIGPNAVIMSHVPAGAIAVAPAARIIMPGQRPAAQPTRAEQEHDVSALH